MHFDGSFTQNVFLYFICNNVGLCTHADRCIWPLSCLSLFFSISSHECCILKILCQEINLWKMWNLLSVPSHCTVFQLFLLLWEKILCCLLSARLAKTWWWHEESHCFSHKTETHLPLPFYFLYMLMLVNDHLI